MKTTVKELAEETELAQVSGRFQVEKGKYVETAGGSLNGRRVSLFPLFRGFIIIPKLIHKICMLRSEWKDQLIEGVD